MIPFKNSLQNIVLTPNLSEKKTHHESESVYASESDFGRFRKVFRDYPENICILENVFGKPSDTIQKTFLMDKLIRIRGVSGSTIQLVPASLMTVKYNQWKNHISHTISTVVTIKIWLQKRRSAYHWMTTIIPSHMASSCNCKEIIWKDFCQKLHEDERNWTKSTMYEEHAILTDPQKSFIMVVYEKIIFVAPFIENSD